MILYLIFAFEGIGLPVVYALQVPLAKTQSIALASVSGETTVTAAALSNMAVPTVA